MIVLVTGSSDPRLMESHKMAGMHRSVRRDHLEPLKHWIDNCNKEKGSLHLIQAREQE